MASGDVKAAAELEVAATAASDAAPTSTEATVPSRPVKEPSLSPDDEIAVPESFVWLRSGDQLVLGVLVMITLGLMIAHWVRLSGWGMSEVEIERLPDREYEYRLDINRATWVEWMQIEEIGEALARRIVEDREANGPFATVDDLRRVRGIGPKTLEKIRPTLMVGADAAASVPSQ